MFTRIWSVKHGARQIRLEYDWGLTTFKRHARLLTDGREIAQWSGSALDGPNAVLSVGRLEAKIAPRGFFAGGQILLDGQPIGGDGWINAVGKEKAQEWAQIPFWRYVARRALLIFGLPFIALTLLFLTLFGFEVARGTGFAGNLVWCLVTGLMFAVVMAWQSRRVYARIAGLDGASPKP